MALAVAAATLPSLLAYNASPSPTFLNQALAFALWAAFLVASAPGASKGLVELHAALGLLGAAALWSWLHGGLPASLALSSIGTLAAAALMAAGGSAPQRWPNAESVFAAFCWGWIVAGALNVAVALLQVFAPDLPDGKIGRASCRERV